MRSISLFCPGCSAIYHARGAIPDDGRHFCRFCDSRLESSLSETETPAPDEGEEALHLRQGPLEVRLWLDDDRADRAAPPGWFQVTTAHEAIRWLESGRVVELSLDHDLGDDERAGRGIDVVDFLAEQQEVHGRNLWPRDGITLHTANPYGRDAMARAIRNYAGKTMRVDESLTAGGKPRFRFSPQRSASS